MSAIHYKFSSSNDYKNVTFDGISISLQDCKKAIMMKEKLKMTEVDLLITNAQSLQDYKDESTLIPKNTALLVRRIPLGAAPDKTKVYVVKKNETAATSKSDSPYMTLDELKKTEDLATANASEQDKIKAMMDQSTTEYDPSKYLKPPRYGSYQRYPDHSSTHSFVKCFKCNQTGHYATQCKLNKPVVERPKPIRSATGIPRSHMIQVNKETRGAMLTSNGQYVVPFIDKKGYDIGKKEKPPFLPEAKKEKEEDEDEPVPDELICLICKEMMHDAVVIPCCGNSYCDECIRNALLESEDHECPTCHKKNISPDSLIANKFLRQAVNKFRNETGIMRKKTNVPVWPRPAPVEAKPIPQPQPTKVSYGPPKAKVQYGQPKATPTAGGAYVVKARTSQVYSVQGYNVKKASNNIMQSQVLANAVAKIEQSHATDISNQQQVPPAGMSSPMDQQSIPTAVTPKIEDYTVHSTPDSAESSKSSPSITSSEIKPLMSVKVEPKINAVNMMVERHTEDSPPPPPPLPPPTSRQPEFATVPVETAAATPPQTVVPEQIIPEEPVPPKIMSLLDDIPGMESIGTHFPLHSQGINITLKNVPPVLAKLESNPPILDPLLNLPPPGHLTQFRPPLATRPILQSSQTILPPRLSIPPPGMPPISGSLTRLSMSLPPMTGPLRLPPPHPMMPLSGPPPNITTSMPPPGIPRLGPPQRLTAPPPIGLLPPGVLSRLPFPPPLGIPPPGIPPPGFVKQSVPPPQIDGQGLPPPPGTDTPPTVLTSVATNDRTRERRRHVERSTSRSKRTEDRHEKSKSRKSKLAMMSDEFTKDIQKHKDKLSTRKRKGRRGRSETRSRSGSYSSSSYSSSSTTSRSSSRSSYSSSGSSSYSSSDSYTESRSRSRTPARRRRKKIKTRHRKSESYSRSRSRTPRKRSRTPSPGRKKKKQASRHRKASPVKHTNSSRRRNRSRSGDRERRRSSRSRSKTRREHRKNDRPGKENEAVIPGMPPQSVLDYQRDIALYDYYKQKYEQDWLRGRILPPSPFKRFINYDPTKVPPPSSQPPVQQPVLREIAPHPGPIPSQPPPHVAMFGQPPPPGDATPTEEDAGLYAFRERTPERFFVPQGPPAPWDPPSFDGDLAERNRLLNEDEYYMAMQSKLRQDGSWNPRDYPRPQRRYEQGDPRARMDMRPQGRERGRYMDERRNRGRTPPMDRHRDERNWDRGRERYPRERRPEIGEISKSDRGYKGSREREHEREVNLDDRKRSGDSRSSRREEESSRSRKRGREYAKQEIESSSRDSQNKKRSRGSRQTPTSENITEPIPPGEGDGTPVRDESRIEFSNDSIKIKVINDKMKMDKKRDRERTHKDRTVAKTVSEEKDSRSKHDKISSTSGSRVRQSENIKPTKTRTQRKDDSRSKNREKAVREDSENRETHSSPIPTAESQIERSPTPTLDENVSPVLVEDIHEPGFEPEPQQELSQEQEPVDDNRTEIKDDMFEEVEPEPVDVKPQEVVPVETKASRSSREHRRLKKNSKTSSRTSSKSKHRENVDLPRDGTTKKSKTSNNKAERSTPTGDNLSQVLVPKSRWDSDEESNLHKNSQLKEVLVAKTAIKKDSPKYELIKPHKSRKIRIKKPEMKMKAAEQKKDDVSKKNSAEQEKSSPGSKTVESRENLEKASPALSDSRRVVVSTNQSKDQPQSTGRSSRLLRPSISAIDEASFEPDYNDDDSEKALSNYAPSDFEANDDNDRKNKERKQLPNPAEFEQQSGQKYDDERFEDGGSEEDYEKSKKKKKHKKRKKHKKHRHYSQESEEVYQDREDDFNDGKQFRTDSEEEIYDDRDGKRESAKESPKKRRQRTSPTPEPIIYEDEYRSRDREGSRSKKQKRTTDREHHGEYRVDHGYEKPREKQVPGGRKRKMEKVWDDQFSEEEERQLRKKANRSPVTSKQKEKKRRVSERDEVYFDNDEYYDDGNRYDDARDHDDKKRHKTKKQKHKKPRKEPSSKEVKTVASRIQRSK